MKVKTAELKELIDYIDSYHNGDYIPVIVDLSRAIYMLHYVEKDDVSELKMQNTCYELFRLVECFYEAHYQQQNN